MFVAVFLRLQLLHDFVSASINRKFLSVVYTDLLLKLSDIRIWSMESLKRNKTKCVNNDSLIFSQVESKHFYKSFSAT
jgi:hypothetical protein